MASLLRDGIRAVSNFAETKWPPWLTLGIAGALVAATSVVAVLSGGGAFGFLCGFAVAAMLAAIRLVGGGHSGTASMLASGGGGAATWRALIDALPDAAIAIDRDLTVLHANKAAHEIFRSMRSGGPLALASRAPELTEAARQILRDRQARTVGLLERLPETRRLDAALSALPDSDGQGPSIVIVVHDISERDRLAQMRADFIAHASHELRTPLAALRGFIETLQGPAREDVAARERFLGIMAKESQRMTGLLDDLLSLSRLEMRANLTPTGRVDVGDTVAQVVRALEPLASAVEAKVTIDAAPGAKIVAGDRDEIAQVFMNLLQNALKYGRKGGEVRIKLEEIGSGGSRRLRVQVSDNGPGIADEHIPRLTERFYRVDTKASREKGGTGLGLAIVKHILNRHSGQLRIESVLGQGSTFTVELPLAE
ncbi:MAG: PAS domain-containing protein [Proteobacteria bacterium]|nr:PAS domain-containing protein [Pseudomonadota bacterium]